MGGPTTKPGPQEMTFFHASFFRLPGIITSLSSGRQRSGIFFIYAHTASLGKEPEAVYHIKTPGPRQVKEAERQSYLGAGGLNLRHLPSYPRGGQTTKPHPPRAVDTPHASLTQPDRGEGGSEWGTVPVCLHDSAFSSAK